MKHPWLTFFIFFAIVVDGIVLYLYWVRIQPRLMKLGRTVEERRQTLAAAGAIVAEGLRESYSGDPDTLPAVLVGIVPRLEEMLSGRGLEPDAGAVRDLLSRSLAQQGVPAAKALEALNRLAA